MSRVPVSAENLFERLQKRAEARRQMEDKYGLVPTSVLRLSRGSLSRSLFSYQREELGTRSVNLTDALSSVEVGGPRSQTTNRILRSAGVMISAKVRKIGESTVQASIMPAELVAFFIKYYADPGSVYLDPFMGQGIQMQVAHWLGLTYWGYDCCEEYVAYIERIRAKIAPENKDLHTFLGDSRSPLHIPDGIGNFCFTSPPYWDTEFYDDSPAQLGGAETYSQFLDWMGEVAKNWKRKFAPNAFVIINAADFVRAGIFYPYHADVIKIFQDAGYQMRDIWIIEGLINTLMRAYAVQFNEARRVPRIHEYAMVFQVSNDG